MFKKAVKTSVPVLMAATVLAACGSNDSKSSDTKETGDKGYTPEKLTVQFVPSQNAETLEAKAKPLEKLLKKELGIPVEVSVSTNYNTIVEAMKSKKVDIGFLPPTAYVLAHDQKAADVLLQAQRYGVNDDGTPTKELVDYYKSQFIVKKDSGIDSLKDMKGKRIAMQDVTSTAGYVFPAVDLKNEGIDPLKDMEVTTVKGHDQAVISLLNDDVDVAVTFQDARNIVKGDQPNVFKDTKIVKYTEKIPNDTIAARSDMTDQWKKKVTDAFIKIGKDKEGQKVIREVYSHEGYVKSDDSKFDIIRDYDKKVKE